MPKSAAKVEWVARRHGLPGAAGGRAAAPAVGGATAAADRGRGGPPNDGDRLFVRQPHVTVSSGNMEIPIIMQHWQGQLNQLDLYQYSG